MIIVLKSIIKCEVLGLNESFQGICFGHVFLRHVNMLHLMKDLQKPSIYSYQVYTMRFVEMYHLA